MSCWCHAGESNSDVFILLRGELHVLDLDQQTFLFKVPEGTVFGEGTVLRHVEVRRTARGDVLAYTLGGRFFMLVPPKGGVDSMGCCWCLRVYILHPILTSPMVNAHNQCDLRHVSRGYLRMYQWSAASRKLS